MMENEMHCEPRLYRGVTISSTFTDLEEHRQAVIKTINANGLHDVAMENDSAKFMDVIESSLQMVQEGSAYIGIISIKYGQVPPDPIRNPENLSITELEFNEALRLNRPILLFIMSEDHLVHRNDIEPDADKKKKLEAFTERAKKMNNHSSVHRVYATFNSLTDFKDKIGPSIAGLERHLEKGQNPSPSPTITFVSMSVADSIPKPPALYAKPDYTVSNKFVGRQSQLDTLNDWARPADQHTILLFDAIGGNGKSMLTWEWTKHYATMVREDWAGIFWYSFYEKGAVMADFCRCALAYITGTPPVNLRKKKTAELKDLLLLHLRSRPWLFILDGLERVLVAYHRIDAAEVADEELNIPTDKIVSRDPCSCIIDEDDELLRSLASAAPSKLLISSRLVPRVLFNVAGQTIPGVNRIPLQGLRPIDAELLFRAYGITGNSEAIQNYLATNCDCHPLTIGVLAGLINNYLPDKGNFGSWVGDPQEGGQLNFANLDLIQKRNHILKAGLHALSKKSSQLLSVLALLPQAVDYSTLSAFNPHIPSEPAKWRDSIEYGNAPKELENTVRDLEKRGLLQYDHHTKRYDLHPVVRGVASGGLKTEETEKYGQQVVDYFSSKPHNPYEKAESLDDVSNGLYIVRTLLRMGHYQAAFHTFRGELASALIFNLEAYNETLTLIRPFFSAGWSTLPPMLNERDSSYLANDAAIALGEIGEQRNVLALYEFGILSALKNSNLNNLQSRLRNIADVPGNWAVEKKILDLSLSLSELDDNDDESLFKNRCFLFNFFVRIGQWDSADEMWNLLDSMGRSWSRELYRPGEVEKEWAYYHFYKNTINQDILDNAFRLAEEGNNRKSVRHLFKLHGMWQIEKNEWQAAVESFSNAIRLARSASIIDEDSETWLALTKYHLNLLSEPISEAERLAKAKEPAHCTLAELWHAIGNNEQAKKHAFEAYKKAWGDGEPYVHRYELNRATELLNRLNVEIPKLPPYDPSKDEKFPWEEKVEALIEKLKAEKEKNKK